MSIVFKVFFKKNLELNNFFVSNRTFLLRKKQTRVFK